VRTEPEPEKTVESPQKELIKTEVKFNPKKEGLELRHPAFSNRDNSLQQQQTSHRQPSRPLSPVLETQPTTTTRYVNPMHVEEELFTQN